MQEQQKHIPWNKGKLMGQKPPLKVKDIWRIRTNLEMRNRVRDLAMFNLAIDSKLRGCDLIKLRVRDVCQGQSVLPRAIATQQKTHQPVQFEITKITRESLTAWIEVKNLANTDFLFSSCVNVGKPIGTRQYARIVEGWVRLAGLDPAVYGTHSMRRTKASIIYRKTHDLRAVQLLLGHAKLESTVRYLGIETDDALELAEQIDV